MLRSERGSRHSCREETEMTFGRGPGYWLGNEEEYLIFKSALAYSKCLLFTGDHPRDQ